MSKKKKALSSCFKSIVRFRTIAITIKVLYQLKSEHSLLLNKKKLTFNRNTPFSKNKFFFNTSSIEIKQLRNASKLLQQNIYFVKFS